MSAPIFEFRTTKELRVERDELLQRMKPFDVDQLRRLRAADEITSEEEDLLEQFEVLTGLIDG